MAAVDQYQGARLATEHLLGLGHETVHHLAGPREWTEAQRRVEGWRDALTAAGAAVPPLARGDWSPGAGYAAGRVALGRPAVSAVFVANDQMALGLMRALHGSAARFPATSAWSASTTSPKPSSSRRR